MSTVLNQLIKNNLLTQEDLRAAREKLLAAKMPLLDFLIETGLLKEEDLFDTARIVFPRPVIDLDQITVDPGLLQLVPLETAITHGIFPVSLDKDILELAMSDPSDIIVRDEIRFRSDLTVKPLLCKKSQITKYVKKYYPAADSIQGILQSSIDETRVELSHDRQLTHEDVLDLLKRNPDDAAVIKLVNQIISDAVMARASDVHIEPQEKETDVRYRIDGTLKHIIRIPRDLYPRVVARIKILARLDIAEQRKAQEGRIKISLEGDKIDLRISMIPLFYGEKVVLRILGNTKTQRELSGLGFEPEDLEIFKEAIQKTQGVILVTGPTGSGKTTTLYAALQHIKNGTNNIVTIEDPIEYLIDGINQLQLSRHKDVTFTNGLKNILRQDPDVILIGEVRDAETASIAFQAALTGHLVFSTLHTNNAVSTITRLANIGVEPYLIASALTLIVAQRLVRMVCPDCREEYVPDEKLLVQYKPYLQSMGIQGFHRGAGCAHCNFSGFYGRTSIFEILKVDEMIRNLICNKVPENLILKNAVHRGLRTLAESGMQKVANGLTTLEEIAKVAPLPIGQERPQPLLSLIN